MRIDAVLFDELLVGASFSNAAVRDYQDFIRIADGGEAVGNGDGGAVLGQDLQALLDPAFALIVQGAGGLI